MRAGATPCTRRRGAGGAGVPTLPVMADHAQAASRYLGTEVDAGIVGLLEYLNRAGCATLYSCQGWPRALPGQPACAYIMFDTALSLERACALLWQVATAAGDLELAGRILGRGAIAGSSVPRPQPWVLQLSWNERPAEAVYPAPPWAVDPSVLALRATARLSHEDAVLLDRLVGQQAHRLGSEAPR